jgi:hypothetical protein
LLFLVLVVVLVPSERDYSLVFTLVFFSEPQVHSWLASI